MSTPVVFKFGGASVKDAEGVRNVARIVERFKDRPMVVVVSAMGKMTNAFETVMHHWSKNEIPQCESALGEIKTFHDQIISDLFEDIPTTLTNDLNHWYQNLSFAIQDQDKGYSEQYDFVVHHGELISTRIVQEFVNLSVPALWIDTKQLVRTDSQFRRATVNWNATEKNIREGIHSDKVNFVQGFIGSDDHGRPTTLGREGSDYTGAVFAYSLGATSLTIWKDVPGMLNGDPKTFSNTTMIHELPFDEAIELAFYGASIIHPKTIQPLKKRGIPLHIKSFLNPDAQGTVISDVNAPNPRVPNFILKKNQALLELSTKDLAFIAEHHLSAVYQLFTEQGVVVNLMRNMATKAVFCINNDAIIVPKAVSALQSTFKLGLKTEVELLTIRHYTDLDVVEQTKGLTILQEQRTPETVQFVFER